MAEKEKISDVGEFIGRYASHMMSIGVHTSRVLRSAKRIGESFGYRTHISAFQRSITLTLIDKITHDNFNEVVEVEERAISFEQNARLSALSWRTLDEHLALKELVSEYENIIHAPHLHPLFILILVCTANASFCELFGGDLISMGIVFSATAVGMFLKQQMLAAKINAFPVFIISAFVASLTASTALIFKCTSETAIATSVLYLVPGVPLLNGVIDIVEGHTLSGLSRLIKAMMLILCIAIGLAFTLLLVKNNLIIQ